MMEFSGKAKIIWDPKNRNYKLIVRKESVDPALLKKLEKKSGSIVEFEAKLQKKSSKDD